MPTQNSSKVYLVKYSYPTTFQDENIEIDGIYSNEETARQRRDIVGARYRHTSWIVEMEINHDEPMGKYAFQKLMNRELL